MDLLVVGLALATFASTFIGGQSAIRLKRFLPYLNYSTPFRLDKAQTPSAGKRFLRKNSRKNVSKLIEKEKAA